MAESGLADWIGAAAGILTALAALPTALFFLLDRRAQRAKRLTARAAQAGPDVLSVLIRFTPEDQSQALIASVRLVRPSDAVLLVPTDEHDDGYGNRTSVTTSSAGAMAVQVPLLSGHMDRTNQVGGEVYAYRQGRPLEGVRVAITVATTPKVRRLAKRTFDLSV